MMITKVFVRQKCRITGPVNDQINNVPFKSHRTPIKCIVETLLSMTVLIMATVVRAAPHAVSDNTMSVTLNHAVWPPMKHHDIWNDDKQYLRSTNEGQEISEESDEGIAEFSNKNIELSSLQFLNNLAVNDIESNDNVGFGNEPKRQSKGMILRQSIKSLMLFSAIACSYTFISGSC